MKLWLDRLKTMKNGPWLLALACCAAALLLLPLGETNAVSMTEEEQRVSIYYAQEASAFGGGNRTPVGALIVAEGAGDITVRLNLLRAAETLLGLDAHQVDVFLMEEKP